jgi:hypothetical protein
VYVCATTSTSNVESGRSQQHHDKIDNELDSIQYDYLIYPSARAIAAATKHHPSHPRPAGCTKMVNVSMSMSSRSTISVHPLNMRVSTVSNRRLEREQYIKISLVAIIVITNISSGHCFRDDSVQTRPKTLRQTPASAENATEAPIELAGLASATTTAAAAARQSGGEAPKSRWANHNESSALATPTHYPNHALADRLATQQTTQQNIDRRNLTIEGGAFEDKTIIFDEPFPVADINQTYAHNHAHHNHQFRPPVGVEFIVEPIASPSHASSFVTAPATQTTGRPANQMSLHEHTPQVMSSDFFANGRATTTPFVAGPNNANLSLTARADDGRSFNWLPVSKRVAQRLQAISPTRPAGEPYGGSLRQSAQASRQDRYLNKDVLLVHQPSMLNANYLTQNQQHINMDNHQRRQHVRNVQREPQSIDIRSSQSAPQSSLYKQLLAATNNQQQLAQQAAILDANLMLNPNNLGPHSFQAPFASVAGQASIVANHMGALDANTATATTQVSQQAIDSIKALHSMPPLKSDIGEDGSSMVTYSLASSGADSNPNLHGLLQQQSSESHGGASGSSTGDATSAGVLGLSQEQLMGIMQQIGGANGGVTGTGTGTSGATSATTAADLINQNHGIQFSFETPNLLGQSSPTTSPIDPTMVSLFENIFKSAMNASSQSQQSTSRPVPSQQPPPPPPPPPPQQQQQQQQVSTASSNHNPQQSIPGSNYTPPTVGGESFRQSATSQKFPSVQQQQQQQQQQVSPYMQPIFNGGPSSPLQMAFGDQPSAATIYSQDSMDPNMIYASNPRRKSKKKRKKSSDKNDGSRNPVVRVQKRPRQQFYEHNSPNDLEPSATFHKWKYPWLYRPPYDDDEDEEEGETEINLRFFNNFSRMGPLGGIARSAAPATFIISLAFLILSNISLAATVIVHGISSFLRNMSPQQPTTMASPPRITGRLARILFTEGRPTQMPTYSKFVPYGSTTSTSTTTTSTTTTTKPQQNEGSSEKITKNAKPTLMDRVIRSLPDRWDQL